MGNFSIKTDIKMLFFTFRSPQGVVTGQSTAKSKVFSICSQWFKKEFCIWTFARWSNKDHIKSKMIVFIEQEVVSELKIKITKFIDLLLFTIYFCIFKTFKRYRSANCS